MHTVSKICSAYIMTEFQIMNNFGTHHSRHLPELAVSGRYLATDPDFNVTKQKLAEGQRQPQGGASTVAAVVTSLRIRRRSHVKNGKGPRRLACGLWLLIRWTNTTALFRSFHRQMALEHVAEDSGDLQPWCQTLPTKAYIVHKASQRFLKLEGSCPSIKRAFKMSKF